MSSPQDQSASCTHRVWNYDSGDPSTPPVPLQAPDLADCQEMLSGVPNSIEPINDGLNTIQFQSLSINPSDPMNSVYGGTQDNGTWSYTGSPTWLEVVGGDGGQSGFNKGDTNIRYHNYFNATPEVNYHGDNPSTWLDTYDVLGASGELQSFYSPFIADPNVPGRVFTGLQHVWRSDDNGGSEASLGSDCNALALNPDREPCGDWQPLGADLTGPAFGTTKSGNYVVADERAPSDNSTLWAGTREGLYWSSGDGLWQRFTQAIGFKSVYALRPVVAAGASFLWLGTDAGAFRLHIHLRVARRYTLLREVVERRLCTAGKVPIVNAWERMRQQHGPVCEGLDRDQEETAGANRRTGNAIHRAAPLHRGTTGSRQAGHHRPGMR